MFATSGAACRNAARVLGLNPTSVLWRVLVATGFPSRSRQGQRAARPTSKRGRKRRAVRAHQLAVQAPHAKERRGGATADGGTGAGAGEAAGAGQGSGDELDSGEELDDGFDSATEGDVSDGEEKSDGEESDGDGSRGGRVQQEEEEEERVAHEALHKYLVDGAEGHELRLDQ